MGAKHLDISTRISNPIMNNAMVSNYGYLKNAYGGRVCARLNSRKPWGSNMLYKFFWSNTDGRNYDAKHSNELEKRSSGIFSSESKISCVTVAGDVDSDSLLKEKKAKDSTVASDHKVPSERCIKLICGSCCLPHPSKEATGGEDAFFICADEQSVGVADGVGGWALHGIDAGEYARELMSNAFNAIKEEPNGFIDPARVLEKAYNRTKKAGSSTACIIALRDQGIHAVNLGDSGFIVVREGSTVFQSPSQQHDFNFPFQLDAGGMGDLPKDAQVFTVPVAPGDVIVAGTDGLFDNLYTHEVAEVIVQSLHANLDPEKAAQKIGALARERALDKTVKSPFAAAASEAGFYYAGGKLDDISVVVSYVVVAALSDS